MSEGLVLFYDFPRSNKMVYMNLLEEGLRELVT